MRALRNILKIALVTALAAEGFLLLRPEGVLVRAARGRRSEESSDTESWWRHSPVHMGCSIASCKRPATRTASYHVPGRRGSTWRAYGFCEKHTPPAEAAGLVYRMGRPPTFDYDVPLDPMWAEVYFLLGTAIFAMWCMGMWRLAASAARPSAAIALFVVHAGVLTVLLRF